MPQLALGIFELERGRTAFEKYAAFTHLTVQVYGADGSRLAGPVYGTPIFELFARGRDLGMFAECARRCLAPEDSDSLVVVEERNGLAVVGTALTLGGDIVGAAVAGYALTMHPGRREITLLARDSELPFDDVWAAMRAELPLPRSRLPLHGELLGVIADTLLSEHDRSVRLEEALRRVAQASEAKDRFLAMVSHELRTPLTAILGYARILRRGTLDAAGVDRALGVIDRNARLQTQLIDDLLDVSAIIAGTLALRVGPMDLAPVIEAAATNVRLAADAKKIQLALVLDPSAGVISGDPVRMQQVVENLLTNAIKFTAPGGNVEVRLRGTGAEIQIVVTDTGIGIRPDFLPDVFDRFRRGEPTTEQPPGGLGLGLAIVRTLVESHGGTVRADSPGEGCGATFTVSLPMMVAPDAPLPEPASPTAASLSALEAR
jgi:signal transduction histidine kinase